MYRAMDVVRRMMPVLRLWPRALLFAQSCILNDTMKPQRLSSSLIEHENLLCCPSDRLCISSFNGCFIQLFMCLSAGYLRDLLHPGFGVRIQCLGGRFGILNRGLCLCSPIYCGERGFFRGGGGRWKRDLMNGDSQNGGCGSLKTQAGWIELRLTGTCPLSSDTQTWYS